MVAQRGDIALVQIDHNPSLGVVEGRTVCGPNTNGLERKMLDHVERAWRVA